MGRHKEPDAIHTLPCAQCGREFTSYKCNHRKFCSLRCAYKNQGRIQSTVVKLKKQRGVAICKGCGNEFTLKTRGGTIYCSHPCACRHIGKINFLANRYVQPCDPSKKVKVKCDTCGKEILKWKANFQYSAGHYCSRDCVNHALVAEKAARTNRSRGTYDSQNCYSRCKRGFRTIADKRIFFRSAMEADYARFLTFMGIKWEYEPKTFWFPGIESGTMSYTPDFFLSEEGRYVECKGWMDAKSKTKLRRMSKYHPEIRVDLIDWKSFRGICRGVGRVIPEWESGTY
jgi:hypothetical protein